MTVDEPAGLVLANVAWHLHLGASEVHVYFDRPNLCASQVLTPISGVRVVSCDAQYWQAAPKGRPDRHEVRQVVNARAAYAVSGADWLLHCDADEFLWAPEGVDAALSAVAPDADAVAVPVAERIHTGDAADQTILAGAFRRPFRGQVGRALRMFGPDYALTNRGLTGHAQGKAFSRVGRQLKPSIHRPRTAKDQDAPALHRAPPAALELLHFEGLTPGHWIWKLTRMARSFKVENGMPLAPHRAAQAAHLVSDPENAPVLYRRLKHPNDRQITALKRFDLLHQPGFDPSAAINDVFAGHEIDLSPQAVTAWLAEKKGRSNDQPF